MIEEENHHLFVVNRRRSFLQPPSTKGVKIRSLRHIPLQIYMVYLIVLGLLFLNLFLGFLVVSNVCYRGGQIASLFHLVSLASRLELVAA